MVTKQLPSATLRYQPADSDTAETIEPLCHAAFSLAMDRWGLAPPTDLRIHVVDSWLGFVSAGSGLLTRLLSTLVLPVNWYELSFSRGWRHTYAMIVVVGADRVDIRAKALGRLPIDGRPPMVLASWERPPAEAVDFRTLWEQEVVTQLAHAVCLRRVPHWVSMGVGAAVTRELVERAWGETLAWQPILRWAGIPPGTIEFAKIHRMPREEIDEYVGRNTWPRWVIEYLDERHPGLLRQLNVAETKPEQFEAALASHLNIPPDRFWEQLGQRVAAHFEGQEEPASAVAQAPAEFTPPPDNPYASPVEIAESGNIAAAKLPPGAAKPKGCGLFVWLFALAGLGGGVAGFLLALHWTAILPAVLLGFPLGLAAGLWALQIVWIGFRVARDLVTGKRKYVLDQP